MHRYKASRRSLIFFFFFLPVLSLSGNHIFQGQAAGIAINENGRGMITGVLANLLPSLPIIKTTTTIFRELKRHLG